MRRVLLLSRVLGRYAVRKVMNIGPLRHPMTRVLLVAAVLGFVGLSTVVCYQFMRPVGDDLQIWAYLYDVVSISIALVTLGVFMGLRLIVGGAASFLEQTSLMPVTQRERRAAVLVFEALGLTLVLTVFLTAMSIATLLVIGHRGLWLAATPVVTAFVVYLTASLVCNLLDRLLGGLGLRRGRTSVVLLLMFAAVVWLHAQVPMLLNTTTLAPLDQPRALLVVNLAPWVLHTAGPWVFVAGSLAAVAVLVLLVSATAPDIPPPARRFLNLRVPALPGPWQLHVAYALRNNHLWIGVTLCVAMFIFLLGNEQIHPLWAPALTVLPGMYHFGNTRGIRAIHPEGSPLQAYLRIIVTQLAVVGLLMAVLTAALGVAAPHHLAGAVGPALGVAGSMIFSVLIGCVFPAEHDNPFSVLTGCLVLVIVLGFVGIVSGLLNPPAYLVTGLLVTLHVAAAAISVAAVQSHERRSQHVHITQAAH